MSSREEGANRRFRAECIFLRDLLALLRATDSRILFPRFYLPPPTSLYSLIFFYFTAIWSVRLGIDIAYLLFLSFDRLI